ncbi:MAG TPA: signal peptidase I, partial [Anaerolineae bacterium]
CIIALAVTFLGTSVVLVAQPSMLPTYAPGDRLFVDKLLFHLTGVHRGDILIVHWPDAWDLWQVKRIVGMPGEQVQLLEGSALIDGKPLEETYLAPGTATEPMNSDNWQLGPQEYFVMGDNRESRGDSRAYGPISAAGIIGRVSGRYATGSAQKNNTTP